jgi:hypothetical protein
MVTCLTGARFVQKADILRSTGTTTDENTGQWVTKQDPDSGEIIRVWEPATDNPNTPEIEGNLQTFPCEARGIIDGGIRVAGTTERFGDEYNAVDYVRISFPTWVNITRRDRVTNIRDAKGHILWKEEERQDGAATVFSVVGVTPVIAPFVGHTENVALLERVEVQ